MNKFLLIDFGATRIKTAVTDLKTGYFSHIRSEPSLPNISAASRIYEVSLPALREKFLAICDFYYEQLNIRFKGVVLCSEMHGFAVLDKNNRPLTNYVSWKDERSLVPVGGIDTFNFVKDEFGPRFKEITGMFPRPGLPFMNVLHIARTSGLQDGCRIVSLPDWFSLCSDDSRYVSHDTMLAGLGFSDVKKKSLSEELLRFFKKISNLSYVLNEAAPLGSISGYWNNKGKNIPIYLGVGDFQCAVLGAGNKPNQTISINIGTGSQVSVIDKEVLWERVELRPFFDSSFLAAITHIPAGRVLTEFLRFIEDICRVCSDRGFDVWSKIRELDEEDILHSTLNFDLALFKSAWNYREGGKISNISEGDLTLNNYLASLIKSFIKQYLEVIRVIDPEKHIGNYILSGGVPKRLPVLAELISVLSACKTLNATSIDETIIGLRTVSLISSGLSDSYLNAQEIYGREVVIT